MAPVADGRGMALIMVVAIAGAQPTSAEFPSARPVGPTFEEDEIDLSNARQWVTVESASCISFNSVDPFDEQSARGPGRFTLAREPQPQQQAAVDAAAISVRALVLFAPLQWKVRDNGARTTQDCLNCISVF